MIGGDAQHRYRSPRRRRRRSSEEGPTATRHARPPVGRDERGGRRGLTDPSEPVTPTATRPRPAGRARATTSHEAGERPRPTGSAGRPLAATCILLTSSELGRGTYSYQRRIERGIERVGTEIAQSSIRRNPEFPQGTTRRHPLGSARVAYPPPHHGARADAPCAAAASRCSTVRLPDSIGWPRNNAPIRSRTFFGGDAGPSLAHAATMANTVDLDEDEVDLSARSPLPRRDDRDWTARGGSSRLPTPLGTNLAIHSDDRALDARRLLHPTTGGPDGQHCHGDRPSLVNADLNECSLH